VSAAAVRIQDTVVLPGAEVVSWTAKLRAEYVPGAVGRGLILESIAREHVDTDAVAVHILWTLPSVGAFFGMRSRAGTDPAVADFWAATDAVALRRTRHVTAVDPVDEEVSA
jgi:hypothetical protein